MIPSSIAIQTTTQSTAQNIMEITFSQSLRAIAVAIAVLASAGAGAEQMKAVQYSEFGDSSVLHYVDVPKPVPGDDEVLVEVYAAGVNPVDWEARKEPLPGFYKTMPIIPGYDIAGDIAGVGRNVKNFAVGAHVFAMLPLNEPHAYAEFAVVQASLLAAQPRNVDALHAAAVPLVALTAYQALFDYGHLQKGQTVFIQGAAGGVGHLAVQLAKSAGATVIGTASAENIEFLKQLGVDIAIDYRAQKFEDMVHDVDLVFDTVGGDTLKRSYDVVRRGGRIVSIAGSVDRGLMAKRELKGQSMLVKPDAEELKLIAQLMEKNLLKSSIEASFTLAQAAQAQDQMQSRHSRGKLVLTIPHEGKHRDRNEKEAE